MSAAQLGNAAMKEIELNPWRLRQRDRFFEGDALGRDDSRPRVARPSTAAATSTRRARCPRPGRTACLGVTQRVAIGAGTHEAAPIRVFRELRGSLQATARNVPAPPFKARVIGGRRAARQLHSPGWSRRSAP